MFCTHCQEPLEDDAVFCSNCGQSVQPTPPAATEPDAAAPVVPNEPTQPPAPQKKSKLGLIIAIAIAVVIAAVAALGFVFGWWSALFSDDSQSENKDVIATDSNSPAADVAKGPHPLAFLNDAQNMTLEVTIDDPTPEEDSVGHLTIYLNSADRLAVIDGSETTADGELLRIMAIDGIEHFGYKGYDTDDMIGTYGSDEQLNELWSIFDDTADEPEKTPADLAAAVAENETLAALFGEMTPETAEALVQKVAALLKDETWLAEHFGYSHTTENGTEEYTLNINLHDALCALIAETEDAFADPQAYNELVDSLNEQDSYLSMVSASMLLRYNETMIAFDLSIEAMGMDIISIDLDMDIADEITVNATISSYDETIAFDAVIRDINTTVIDPTKIADIKQLAQDHLIAMQECLLCGDAFYDESEVLCEDCLDAYVCPQCGNFLNEDGSCDTCDGEDVCLLCGDTLSLNDQLNYSGLCQTCYWEYMPSTVVCDICYNSLDENGECAVCAADQLSGECLLCGEELTENDLWIYEGYCYNCYWESNLISGFCMSCGGWLNDDGSCDQCEGGETASTCMTCGTPISSTDQWLYDGECSDCYWDWDDTFVDFCSTCGEFLDENGLCPSCDKMSI